MLRIDRGPRPILPYVRRSDSGRNWAGSEAGSTQKANGRDHVLRVREFPVPKSGPSDILLKVRATSVNLGNGTPDQLHCRIHSTRQIERRKPVIKRQNLFSLVVVNSRRRDDSPNWGIALTASTISC